MKIGLGVILIPLTYKEVSIQMYVCMICGDATYETTTRYPFYNMMRSTKYFVFKCGSTWHRVVLSFSSTKKYQDLRYHAILLYIRTNKISQNRCDPAISRIRIMTEQTPGPREAENAELVRRSLLASYT